ncbi:putative glycolipid-binding domain-containing protein [Actinopolymorpha alba]|uniref:putative glycolipid-binding domain-containing protein n=1 Tax=Actinopolymorpha alba TaxID=533267 RepID=UPI0003AA6654|nr:putative glycolipid-binding domain-containing protein [Actinopolymorpha alba]
MIADVHHSLVWLKDAGAELVEVKLARGRLSATGSAIGADPVPYRLEYILTTGDFYVTSSLRVHTSGHGWRRSLELHRDGDGSWRIVTDQEGHLDAPPPGGDPALWQGALDCDLGLCPLTNTMPVLRHGLLDKGDPVDLVMAWVSVPDLTVTPSAQRYSPLSRTDESSVVRFESDGFCADILFDRDGLVLDYPSIARRAC